jgi:hypothetical protein
LSDESIIKAAANVLIITVLDLLQNDSHQWGERPCPTCRSITIILGRKFGCYLYAEQKAAQRKKVD